MQWWNKVVHDTIHILLVHNRISGDLTFYHR